jgi:hypothetical protein
VNIFGDKHGKNWLDAIIKVLSESEIPLHYIRIADLIIERNYYKTNGVSPKNAVNTLLAVSVRYDPKSPFLRVGRGIYTMKKLPPK